MTNSPGVRRAGTVSELAIPPPFAKFGKPEKTSSKKNLDLSFLIPGTPSAIILFRSLALMFLTPISSGNCEEKLLMLSKVSPENEVLDLSISDFAKGLPVLCKLLVSTPFSGPDFRNCLLNSGCCRISAAICPIVLLLKEPLFDPVTLAVAKDALASTKVFGSCV